MPKIYVSEQEKEYTLNKHQSDRMQVILFESNSFLNKSLRIQVKNASEKRKTKKMSFTFL